MLDLNDVALFVEIARIGTFAEAARRLGVPPSTVSRRVQQLEERLGTRLLQRSTRKLTLTGAGEAFNGRCAASMNTLIEAVRELMTDSQGTSGLMRVAAPADFFDFFQMEWVTDFLEAHPRVRIEFVLDDARADLIAEQIDVAFCWGLLQDSALVGQQVISDADDGLVASPAYIAARGAPNKLQDLTNHECLSFAHPGSDATWQLTGPDGVLEKTRVAARISGNTMQSLRKAAMAGLGIARLPHVLVKLDLRTGKLVRVLPHYKCSGHGLNVLYPSRRQLPRVVSTFIDLVIGKLNALETSLPYRDLVGSGSSGDTPARVGHSTARRVKETV